MDIWDLIHRERERLAELLDGLEPAQWAAPSLCSDWRVEEVTAHLTAAARTGATAWVLNMARARFDAGRHNARLLRRCLGADPTATLALYRRSVPLRVTPTRHLAGMLGEVLVHGQDIARPLGLELRPDPRAVREVAGFFAARDFAVNSRSAVAGLRLEADDADIAHGDGPVVAGPALDLVLAMAGRPQALPALRGEGFPALRARVER